MAAAAGKHLCVQNVDVEYGACYNAADPVTACREDLARQPKDFRTRAALCEAHADRGDYDEAIAVLNAGNNAHAGDGYTRRLIERMISNVTEASMPDTNKGPDMDTMIDYLVLRCTTLANLQACDEAISLDAENGRAHAGRGDILTANKDFAGAIKSYRESQALDDSPEDIGARLAAVREQRLEIVQSCLRSTSAAALRLCRDVVLPGEDDSHAIYTKIGDLELADGNIGRARRAYENANNVRRSEASAGLVATLASAGRCVDGENVAACLPALEAVPTFGKFAVVRGRVTMAGCRALMNSGEHMSGDMARDVCEEARRLNQFAAAQTEINQLLAQATPTPSVPDPPAPDLTRKCLDLARHGDDVGAAIDVCESALSSAGVADDSEDIRAALDTLRARRADEQGLGACEIAVENEPLGAAIDRCRYAAQYATSDTVRDRLQSIVAGLEFRELAERCTGDDGADDAMDVCRQALQKALTDSDREVIELRMALLADAAGRGGVTAGQVVEFSNEPLHFERGIEAITY